MNNFPSDSFIHSCDNIFYGKKAYKKTIKYEESIEDKLDKIDFSIIERYVRNKKLKNINKK